MNAEIMTAPQAGPGTPISQSAGLPAPGSLLPADSQPSTVNPQPFRGESDRAFEAFLAYWELGPRRRYSAVARKVGVCLRTVKGWAAVFDWRGRIKTCAAQCAEQSLQTAAAVQCEELLDAAARAKAFRERQYALAEGILDAAERYLENLADDDMDHMSFADACKALEVASRLGQSAANSASEDPAAPARSLRDQLEALLDQAYADPAQHQAGAQPHCVAPPPAKL